LLTFSQLARKKIQERAWADELARSSVSELSFLRVSVQPAHKALRKRGDAFVKESL
jgi:hypothetical protein